MIRQIADNSRKASSHMSTTAATAAPNRAQRRHPERLIPVRVAATVEHTVSRRGLAWTAYFGLCPTCCNRRQFTHPGRRICPCGQYLDIVTGEAA